MSGPIPIGATHWLEAILAALVSGMAKTGVPGMGILAVPLLAIALDGDGRSATGLLLPLLCCADCFAVFWYRRHARWDHLARLLPWVVVGMIPGWLTLEKVRPEAVNAIIGIAVLAMVSIHVWRKRAGDAGVPRGRWSAPVFGGVAGYVTTVSNAAGPVMNLYLLSMGFAKDAFMGTGALYFFIINLTKAPLYALMHDPIITAQSLAVDARLLPAVVIGALSGRWLYARVPQRAFDIVVIALTAIAAVKMTIPSHAAPTTAQAPAATAPAQPARPEQPATTR